MKNLRLNSHRQLLHVILPYLDKKKFRQNDYLIFSPFDGKHLNIDCQDCKFEKCLKQQKTSLPCTVFPRYLR